MPRPATLEESTMTTHPGKTAFTAHELYALIQPAPGKALSAGAVSAFGFPGPDPDPAMYAAGISTLAIRNRLNLAPQPPQADPETATVARLMQEASLWVRLLLVTGEGRQALRVGLGPRGHVFFTPDGEGAYSVDLLSSGEHLVEDLSGILTALLRPLVQGGEALLLASAHDQDGERPANLRVGPGTLGLAAGPVDAEGRLPEIPVEGIDAAARMMASRLVEDSPA